MKLCFSNCSTTIREKEEEIKFLLTRNERLTMDNSHFKAEFDKYKKMYDDSLVKLRVIEGNHDKAFELKSKQHKEYADKLRDDRQKTEIECERLLQESVDKSKQIEVLQVKLEALRDCNAKVKQLKEDKEQLTSENELLKKQVDNMMSKDATDSLVVRFENQVTESALKKGDSNGAKRRVKNNPKQIPT